MLHPSSKGRKPAPTCGSRAIRYGVLLLVVFGCLEVVSMVLGGSGSAQQAEPAPSRFAEANQQLRTRA